MANIKIYNLHPAGSELFSDSESYMNELGNSELELISGGLTPALIWSVVNVASRLSSARCAIAAGGAIACVSGAVSGWITGGKD